MREPPKIVNYIEIDGEDVLISSLPEEKRKQIALMIQDRIMESVGYKRRTG